MLIVSTGRCGTVRLTEILQQYLSKDFTVHHQLPVSRIANVIGNILYYTGNNNVITKWLYRHVLKSKTTPYYINTDPLAAMVIPQTLVEANNVAIIHIYRDKESFARSFFRFSRKRLFSFIAHNFIPFWQIHIFPLQNMLWGSKMIRRYEQVATTKNNWFIENYKSNPHFLSISMADIFSSGRIEAIINNFFGTSIKLDTNSLQIKANTSQ